MTQAILPAFTVAGIVDAGFSREHALLRTGIDLRRNSSKIGNGGLLPRQKSGAAISADWKGSRLRKPSESPGLRGTAPQTVEIGRFGLPKSGESDRRWRRL